MDLQPRHLVNEWVKLTPLVEDDFDVLYRVACDPLIWEQHPNPDRYKKDIFQNYFAGALASKGAFLISSMDGDVIGSTRFYDFFSEKGEVKIGYTFFSRTCWGMPYNRATKHLMLTYAFQFVPRVIFHVGAQNIRSQKAMEKLGAIKIGEEQVAYYGEETRLNYVYMVEAQSQLFTV
jgi:RimJ/RimL family protein N-acetyltransferase